MVITKTIFLGRTCENLRVEVRVYEQVSEESTIQFSEIIVRIGGKEKNFGINTPANLSIAISYASHYACALLRTYFSK